MAIRFGWCWSLEENKLGASKLGKGRNNITPLHSTPRNSTCRRNLIFTSSDSHTHTSSLPIHALGVVCPAQHGDASAAGLIDSCLLLDRGLSVDSPIHSLILFPNPDASSSHARRLPAGLSPEVCCPRHFSVFFLKPHPWSSSKPPWAPRVPRPPRTSHPSWCLGDLDFLFRSHLLLLCETVGS